MRFLEKTLCVLALACDEESGADCPQITRVGAPCQATVTHVCAEVAEHVPLGTPIVWGSNPPALGSHYPEWPRWGRTYEMPAMDRGYWVHSLEHGGVALLFNCPSGCPEVVDGLETVMAGIPDDPKCAAPPRLRALVTADAFLPNEVQVAAAAWGFTYTATCLNSASLAAFVTSHYGMGPEDFCGEGQVPE